MASDTKIPSEIRYVCEQKRKRSRALVFLKTKKDSTGRCDVERAWAKQECE
jgi:hypothetical protein